MKTPTKISINDLPILLKEEKEVTMSLGEALRNSSKKKDSDEYEPKHEGLKDFIFFIAIILFGVLVFKYLSERAEKKDKKKFDEDQDKWDKIIHLFKKYEETKSSDSFQELHDLFHDLDFLNIDEGIYLMVNRLKIITEYKDAILAYIKSLINPVNKRDYFRKKMRFLFKNLDDEHSFNVILN